LALLLFCSVCAHSHITDQGRVLEPVFSDLSEWLNSTRFESTSLPFCPTWTIVPSPCFSDTGSRRL
jgi:hypothetical protein